MSPSFPDSKRENKDKFSYQQSRRTGTPALASKISFSKIISLGHSIVWNALQSQYPQNDSQMCITLQFPNLDLNEFLHNVSLSIILL